MIVIKTRQKDEKCCCLCDEQHDEGRKGHVGFLVGFEVRHVGRHEIQTSVILRRRRIFQGIIGGRHVIIIVSSFVTLAGSQQQDDNGFNGLQKEPLTKVDKIVHPLRSLGGVVGARKQQGAAHNNSE